ncbi:hypothetical protein CIHG_09234 [Coccidioides immitis H538.4]|uniref:Uncharacterized protein n=1 Tax=Coccidioides immitis H538.4 TaxID=396776 RepID=A0A0J8S2S8_COCIT|nr:hypothetical protein CIHG_09234 [Coccidioides immitis H538.4]
MLVSENEWLGCARKSESRRPPAPRLLEMLLRWPAVRRPYVREATLEFTGDVVVTDSLLVVPSLRLWAFVTGSEWNDWLLVLGSLSGGSAFGGVVHDDCR